MAYVLTDGSTTVVTYPYSIGLLRGDNPNVSFPASPSDTLLAEWNVFPVQDTTIPPYNIITENIIEANPVFDDVNWVQVWTVVSASAEEIADRTASYEASANAEAARLLQETETYWIQAFETGVGIHPDLDAYRTALKTPSLLSGYPVNPVWPTFPTNIYDNGESLPINVYEKPYIDSLVNTFTLGIGDKVNKAGDAMSGELDMGFNKIVGLADPEWEQDAVNKQYVDTKLSLTKEWRIIANTTVSNSAIALPVGYATVADLLADAEEGMIVVKDGNEYVSSVIAAVAVQGYPASFPLHKGGTHLADFTFNASTDTTFSVTITNGDQVIVLMR